MYISIVYVIRKYMIRAAGKNVIHVIIINSNN